jgi:hypothetical protein
LPAVEPGAARWAAWEALAGWLVDGRHEKPAGDPDWEAVAALAVDMRLGPLLYYHLREAGIALPAAVDESLQRTHLASSLVALVANRTLAEMVGAFREAGIDAIVLKGFALSETIYPDAAARPMTDLDLLVHQGDMDRAAACLRRLGYLPAPTHAAIHDHESDSELQFAPVEHAGVMLDLHWGFVNAEWFRGATRIRLDDVWQRAVPLAAGPLAARQLSPVDTLIYLCLHLAVHHDFDGMHLFVDLDRFLHYGPALDWAACVSLCRDYRLRTVVYLALDYARRLLNTPVPPEVLRSLEPPAWVRWAVGRLADPLQIVRGRPHAGLQGMRFRHFLLVDRWQDRLWGMVRLFLPGRHWISMRYEARSPLRILFYCAWHPFRMAWLGTVMLGKLVRSRLTGRAPFPVVA